MDNAVILRIERIIYLIRVFVEDYAHFVPNKTTTELLPRMLDLVSYVYYQVKIKDSYHKNRSFVFDKYKNELERIFSTIVIDRILNKNNQQIDFHEFVAALIINIYYQITKENHNKFYDVATYLANEYINTHPRDKKIIMNKTIIMKLSDIDEEFNYLLGNREDN